MPSRYRLLDIRAPLAASGGSARPPVSAITLPLRLAPKEGLALLNGVQFSSTYVLQGLLAAQYLLAPPAGCAAASA